MSEKWTRDTGLVFALVFLFAGYKWDVRFLAVTALLLVLLMFAPAVLSPLARAWLMLAELLGKVVNKVFFGIVYFLVIVPVALVRRFAVGDARDLARETARATALAEARGKATKKDIARPY